MSEKSPNQALLSDKFSAARQICRKSRRYAYWGGMFEDKTKRILEGGLKQLQTSGFKVAEVTRTESTASGVFYTASYRSETARRGVVVSYFPKFDTARASIEDLDNEFNFGDAGAMKIPHPRYEDMEGEKEAKLFRFLQCLETELLSKYKAVLQGGGFENDAFDWSPYK